MTTMQCPSCAKQLPTKQGTRIHHTKVHGEPLPNRTCQGCEIEFYDSKARRKYCTDCNPNAGKHNGNWHDAKEVASCKQCESTFNFYPSNKKGVYCPTCVEDSDEFLGEQYVKEADRVEVECNFCGSQMSVLESRIENGGGKFCSKRCLANWMSENRRGPNHHQWEGGTINYGRKWWAVRRQALCRDEYTCQRCGLTKDDLGCNPDVHHILRVRDFDNPQQAHTLDNVVSLCRNCHRNVEAGNVPVPTSLE